MLEIAGEFTGYAGWLMADLGAPVTYLSFANQASPPGWWPLNIGKTSVSLDPETEHGSAELESLIAGCDVILQPGGADAAMPRQLHPSTVRSRHPDVIHAILSPYGQDGPKSGCSSTDLVRLAAGGLLWLGGYPDAEPVAAYGDQSGLCTGLFGVIAVMLAALERDSTGVGCVLDVSAQEVLVQALETSLAEYELLGHVRRRVGGRPREAGTGVYPCVDGFISVVAGRLGTSRAWQRLREWLQEAEISGAADLFEPDWESLAFRQSPAAIARFGEVFGTFTATRSKQELYLEAQRRSIALAPVNSPADVLVDEQLRERRFFREVTHPDTGARAVVPSAPYRFRSLRPTAVAS